MYLSLSKIGWGAARVSRHDWYHSHVVVPQHAAGWLYIRLLKADLVKYAIRQHAVVHVSAILHWPHELTWLGLSYIWSQSLTSCSLGQARML